MKKGFTLIELIVVIAIIAILGAVVAPNVFRSIEKARSSSTVQDYQAVKSAVMAYQADLVSWPPDGCEAGLQSNSDCAGGTAGTAWDGPYIDRWPAQSKWNGGVYTYENDNSIAWDGAGGDAARYVQITLVPTTSAVQIDRALDGTTATATTGVVRYADDGSGNDTNNLQILIQTGVQVN